MFLIHTISSIIASVLIVWLAIACKLNKKQGHLIISIVMVIAGLTSLISSLLYGFIIDLSLTWPNIHYWTGFASLTLSLIPMIALITKDDRWHPYFGYAAAIMVIISLITGFIAFSGTLMSYFVASDECVSLNDTNRCLVAVDGVVYDMTSMPRWGTGQHFDYSCGGNYTSTQLPESHSASKYYGPIIGRLC